MEIDERKKRAMYLKTGDISKIADSAGVTNKSVYDYINGLTRKSKVEVHFVALTTRRIKEVEKNLGSGGETV